MKEIKPIIPNSLTIIRILFSLALLNIRFLEKARWNTLTLIVGITILIYLTDYFDGKLARYWNCCSKTGEILDIFADFFYITSQYMILSYDGKMPAYLLPLVVVEFAVFIGTSAKIMQMNYEKLFFFEKIGRFMAVYYYILPLLYMLPFTKNNLILEVLCVYGTILAIGYRIYQTYFGNHEII